VVVAVGEVEVVVIGAAGVVGVVAGPVADVVV
jgi:hypothetical protein